MKKKFDLVIFGATGFTGKLAAEYVHAQYPGIKYALAGRSLTKLESVRDSLGDKNIPLLVADAQDSAALDQLAASAKVVANYAGTPFLDKALPVIEACTRHGTCYVDITGEIALQRASYDRYHEAAIKSKSLIIHSTGYDSIPSDLGAMLAADAMKKRHGCKCKSIQLVAGESKGGVSGGTFYTGLGLMFGSQDLPGMKEVKELGCYGLDPKGASRGPDTSDTVSSVEYDQVSGGYVVPFIMAPANSPVVRKSNAIFGYRYGRTCSYREVAAVPSWLAGVASLGFLGLFGLLVTFPPTRWLLMKTVLPKPGQGPSKKVREEGCFESLIYAVGDGTDEEPKKTVAYVRSGTSGDPGYKSTAQMSVEAALCMALQREKCHPEGGVLTPATGLGMLLVDRLNVSGMELGVK